MTSLDKQPTIKPMPRRPSWSRATLLAVVVLGCTAHKGGTPAPRDGVLEFTATEVKVRGGKWIPLQEAQASRSFREAARAALSAALEKTPPDPPVIAVQPATPDGLLQSVLISTIGATAQYARLRCAKDELEFMLPNYSGSGFLGDAPADPSLRGWHLTVALSKDGFFLASLPNRIETHLAEHRPAASLDAPLGPPQPTIPLRRGELDYAALDARLAAASEEHRGDVDVVFVAEESSPVAPACAVLKIASERGLRVTLSSS